MKEKRILRFTMNERVQHFVIFITFLILFLSGFSLKYGTTDTGGFLIRLMGGMENRNLLHRIGAIGLMASVSITSCMCCCQSVDGSKVGPS